MANDAVGESSYQKRIPIHPRSVKGPFRRFKLAIMLVAYGVYFLLPWLRWERETGPNQAVMFDIPGRTFYIFDLTVFAQDIFWLAGFLIIGAWLLFFATSVFGRVFCGYFCFQTLWTDAYMYIERFIQGDRPRQKRLYNGPWNMEKIGKYAATHISWLLLALLTGLTFTLYWADAPSLVMQMVQGEAPFAAYATTGILMTTTYVMAGLAREQVCTYMCPYARFQSAMFDRDTLIVGYDANRGERENGRHPLKKGLKTREERMAQGYGDCIDCGLCVQVCPTGIDIRDGLQYQCISCALCIDACNNIMDSVNFPRGLVRYSSENELEGGKTHFFKFKNIGYAIGILVASTALVWSIVQRDPVEFYTSQVRQPLAVTLSDGRIQNRYDLRVSNKSTTSFTYQVRVEGLSDPSVDMGGYGAVEVAPEETSRLRARVSVDPERIDGGQTHFEFVLETDDERLGERRSTATFYVPGD
ncbi:MAG: cytochrome c oxidase accessory protein CcoG [Pseudomonadota bacterium]